MKKNWEVKKLGDICTVIAGQSPQGKYYNSKSEGLPFYQGKKGFSDKYICEPTTWTTDITKEAVKGDILMSVRAPVGPVNFSTGHICIGRGLSAIRASKLIDKEFLFNFLIKHENEIVGNTGAVFNSINKTQIENISIPLPPLTEQKRIVAILDKAFAAISTAKANTEKNLQNARELFESYLQGVFANPGDGWEEKKMGEVCDVRDGTHDSPQYVPEGIPFVTQKNITENGLDIANTKRISLADHESFYKRSNVSKGDIIISMIGANRGMACLVNESTTFSIKNVGLVKANPKVNQDYLLYFLKSPKAKEYVSTYSKGGAQEFIGLTELRKFPVLFAPLSEQKRIVGKLDTLLAETKKLEATYQQKIADLEELKKAILQKAFNGELAEA